MLQIRIDQQFAQIGLNITKPFLSMQIKKPQIELNIEEPKLEIHSPRPKIYIDQRQCFADKDRRGIQDFMDYWTGIAKNKAIEATAAISSEGDMLAQIEKGITIEDLAAQAMDNMVDYNVTAVPKQPPKIEADVRPVEIKLHRGTVDLKLHRGRVEPNFQWGKVQVYIEQQNYLKISWEESFNREA